MKTETEIRQVLESHRLNMRKMSQSKTELENVAKIMGWSTEKLLGYAQGVLFAYEWVLEEDEKR